MTAPPRSEQTGDRRTCRLGEGGGAADVLKAAFVVVPAEQQRAGNGQRTGDRADDRLARLADLLAKRQYSIHALLVQRTAADGAHRLLYADAGATDEPSEAVAQGTGHPPSGAS
ncbi:MULTISPECIES: hypothetical protein [unclassified Streptomyces]|uniref:hypothetical protein n=1 Tax=unclassified Streptomyces TaxID=2593676 RepID=UPI0004CAF5BB|nr:MULTISPECIES: hypothetical protein [unclassified Streptomyces]KOX00263.1 hypothetical protein ADL02_03675 [Streptomyces sp. NRRL WC-3723]